MCEEDSDMLPEIFNCEMTEDTYIIYDYDCDALNENASSPVPPYVSGNYFYTITIS